MSLSLAGGLHVHEILGRARISGAGARGGDRLGGAGLAGWLPGPCPWLAVTSPVAVCSHGLSSRHAQGGSGGPLPDAPSGLLRSQAKNRAGRSGGKNGSAGRGTEQRDTSTHGRGRGGTGGPGPGPGAKPPAPLPPLAAAGHFSPRSDSLHGRLRGTGHGDSPFAFCTGRAQNVVAYSGINEPPGIRIVLQ